MRPRAFVVMPFGTKEARAAAPATAHSPASAAIEIDFDAVYESLIKPALESAGCFPFRADKEPGAGDIRTDMYYELVTADIVVADISILNANVFYELGVRHGVAARGVFMIHGGWSKRPFDVAPDRTFDYDGRSFVGHNPESEEWKARVSAEAARLGDTIQGALQVDAQTVGSPVYSQMVGLKPVDWSGLKTARAKYFGEVFVDWQARVQVARLNGWPGDILTLADEAPTRFHRIKLLWSAADALCSMHRFEAALSVLQDLVALEPGHRDGQTRLGLVLARLGKVNEAKVHMLGVATKHQNDTEAHGILGRVYKDLWRLEWKDLPSPGDRQRAALATSAYAGSAVRSYDQAARRNFDYYTGINVISIVKLLEHLKVATGLQPVDCKITDVDELVAVVRFAAQNVVDTAGMDSSAGVWAAATLGELELVLGNCRRAAEHYDKAANAPSTEYFAVNSMLDQIYLFDNLEFQPDCVAPVMRLLEDRRTLLEARIGGLKKSEPRFGKVAIASGHLIDTAERLQERFPARKEAIVRQQMATRLDEWKIGAGDLALCGGARGADILFAELCADRGAQVWLLLALPENEFLEASVRLANSDWEDRFLNLVERPGVTVLQQSERLKSPPKDTSVFARNNTWIVNTARVEMKRPRDLYALLVWDEKPVGDGPGGTADFGARVKVLGGRKAIINPLRL